MTETALGAEGWGFESLRPDHKSNKINNLTISGWRGRIDLRPSSKWLIINRLQIVAIWWIPKRRIRTDFQVVFFSFQLSLQGQISVTMEAR